MITQATLPGFDMASAQDAGQVVGGGIGPWRTRPGAQRISKPASSSEAMSGRIRKWGLKGDGR